MPWARRCSAGGPAAHQVSSSRYMSCLLAVLPAASAGGNNANSTTLRNKSWARRHHVRSSRGNESKGNFGGHNEMPGREATWGYMGGSS